MSHEWSEVSGFDSMNVRKPPPTSGAARVTFDGLRHTHISHLLLHGVHLKVASERAGHADVTVTMTIQATFLPNMPGEAGKTVDAWLGGA
jgi:integrase